MCGIVGYVGSQDSLPILLEGLRRLEYRGYDSAGVAILNGGGLSVQKAAGKIAVLEALLDGSRPRGSLGIAHTRWATHGEPTTVNAHPHVDCKGNIAVVHNGIIENYVTVKKKLEQEGHRFTTDTDTEVIAHLIEKYFEGNLERAVALALQHLTGTYGIAVIARDDPSKIVGARHGSPLVVGICDSEYVLASDVSAIIRHTNQVVYLDDGEMVTLTPSGIHTTTIREETVSKRVETVDWELDMIEKAGFPHFMLKEIFEQPQSLRNTLRGRLIVEEGTARLGGLNMSPAELRAITRVVITACGTSWHAGMIGEYMIEELARIPVEVEYASEFRYRNPILEPGTLVLVISQSGETADTLAAMREAKRRGARVLGFCNVVGSTIARESDGGVYIHAGPEIGVASTKAFTSQVAALALLTLYLGRLGELSSELGAELARELELLPEKLERILAGAERVKAIARAYAHHNNFLYLGRGYNFPVALEGALKLKEISYIHAEGYPAAEMKHGPIALIDQNMPVVFICTQDSAYEKVLSNMEEVRARRGKIIAIASEGDDHVATKADHVIYIPKTLGPLTPLLAVLPLQLLAYHIAVERGCDVDQPRNLAKSVTVE
ncbi:MAG: glutamine--fructose-6-phosphate transaminase (isomerizing) [Candidatus Eisenbacteria bacterium]|uniref:Glutamine--fructose-6-phosphate aminotransferase [isomerizing] n=1 Tax=Eiseniibacteriota bacterium TaxID=2212470 RepID=A0A538SCN3_UNCEI|nr:MAG: glutamine--fructose-6-phosphate transaminase (isomerizing) [Candidatus Eisenbacteria bacterium]TMQ56824.1 MAG: glutamine--fructose-6-phosphate transaminase (isomerizing) [Candidatus Eisenbacteria bacterium]